MSYSPNLAESLLALLALVVALLGFVLFMIFCFATLLLDDPWDGARQDESGVVLEIK